MRRIACLGLCAALLAGAPTAHAGDVAAAETAFAAAKKLADAKNWAQACPKFLASYNFDPGLGTLLNLADCYENLGAVASSWGRWKQALEWAKKDSDDRVGYIQERITKIEPRLPHLKLEVLHPDTPLILKRGDDTVLSGTFGLELPLDPGPVKVSVFRGETLLEERQGTAVEGKLLVMSLDLAAVAAAHPESKKITTDAPPQGPYNPTQRYVGLGLGAGGLLATLIAGGLEVGALVKKGQATESSACVNGQCTEDGLQASKAAERFANIGQWVGIGGLVVLAAGVTVFLTAPSPPRPSQEPATALTLTPWLGPDRAGAGLSGRW